MLQFFLDNNILHPLDVDVQK